ncbi:MAG: hypothetical protein R3F43_03670 [bacterium]
MGETQIADDHDHQELEVGAVVRHLLAGLLVDGVCVSIWKEWLSRIHAARLAQADEVHEALAVGDDLVLLVAAEPALEAQEQRDQVRGGDLLLGLVPGGEQLVDAVEEGGAGALGAEDLLLQQVGQPAGAPAPLQLHVQELVVGQGHHHVAHGFVEVVADLVGRLAERAELLVHEAAQLSLDALDGDVIPVALDLPLEADDQPIEIAQLGEKGRATELGGIHGADPPVT